MRLLPYLIVLLIGPALASAQVAHPVLSLRTGDTVRVWTSSPAEQVGVVTSAGADSLAIRRRNGTATSFAIPAISHVDVQRGSRRSPVVIVAGILGGAVVGAIAGSFAGAGLECLGGCDGEWGGVVGFVWGGLLGGVGGAVGGGILGARYRSRNWEKVYP